MSIFTFLLPLNWKSTLQPSLVLQEHLLNIQSILNCSNIYPLYLLIVAPVVSGYVQASFLYVIE